MYIDTVNQNDIIRKCTETAWDAVFVHKMPEGSEKRKKANELGHTASKLILDLIRIEDSDFAVEIGMTAIQMFFDGHNYHQVLACIEGLKEFTTNSRLLEDVIEYKKVAINSINNFHPKTKEDKIDILYNLVWEKGCIGTTDSIKIYKKRTNLPISEPTIVSYCKMLKYEHRILLFGGPTGIPIEMYPNNSISLNRKSSYEKVNFFEGNLTIKNNLFKPVWESPKRKNTNVYEIENGNDPRVFALIEPGISIPHKYKSLGGISKMPPKLGVEGKLFSSEVMPQYGFKFVENIQDADFLTDCKIRVLEAQ